MTLQTIKSIDKPKMPTEYKPKTMKLDLHKLGKVRMISDSDSDTEEDQQDLLLEAGAMTAFSARTERKMTVQHRVRL